MEKTKESFAAVIPVTLLVFVLYLTPFVTLTTRELRVYAISTVFLVQGIAMFNLGADLTTTYMGENISSVTTGRQIQRPMDRALPFPCPWTEWWQRKRTTKIN